MCRKERLTVGVIGGMGPEATLAFFGKVLQRTRAAGDDDHLHLIIDNDPHVPNRNLAVAGLGPSPANELSTMARRLEQAGADFLVMPCNAAHAFKDAIEEAVSIPLIDIIELTRDELLRCYPGARRVGVLASSGCVDAGLYQSAFAGRGVEVLVPRGLDRDRFMSLLYSIKSGNKSAEVKHAMRCVARGLVGEGAEVIVAGCTEVPLVLDDSDLPCPLIDSLEVLAASTVRRALTSA